MFSRRLRYMIPCKKEQLSPQSIDPNKLRKTMQGYQIKQNNIVTEPRENCLLKVGESVHLQRDNLWEPAKVVSQHKEHSYNVQTQQGAMYRKNGKFLNKTPSETSPPSETLSHPQVQTRPAENRHT